MASVSILNNYNSPFWVRNDLQHPLEDIFRELLVHEAQEQEPWVPSVDMRENEKEYTIHAELPGVKKEDITLDFNGKYIVLSGQRSDRKKEKNERVHRIERSHGKFTRSFKLPKNADSSKIEANYENGVLELTIGKLAKPTHRRIEINSSYPSSPSSSSSPSTSSTNPTDLPSSSSSSSSSSSISQESLASSSSEDIPSSSSSSTVNPSDQVEEDNFIHVDASESH